MFHDGMEEMSPYAAAAIDKEGGLSRAVYTPASATHIAPRLTTAAAAEGEVSSSTPAAYGYLASGSDNISILNDSLRGVNSGRGVSSYTSMPNDASEMEGGSGGGLDRSISLGDTSGVFSSPMSYSPTTRSSPLTAPSPLAALCSSPREVGVGATSVAGVSHSSVSASDVDAVSSSLLRVFEASSSAGEADSGVVQAQSAGLKLEAVPLGQQQQRQQVSSSRSVSFPLLTVVSSTTAISTDAAMAPATPAPQDMGVGTGPAAFPSPSTAPGSPTPTPTSYATDDAFFSPLPAAPASSATALRSVLRRQRLPRTPAATATFFSPASSLGEAAASTPVGFPAVVLASSRSADEVDIAASRTSVILVVSTASAYAPSVASPLQLAAHSPTQSRSSPTTTSGLASLQRHPVLTPWRAAVAADAAATVGLDDDEDEGGQDGMNIVVAALTLASPAPLRPPTADSAAAAAEAAAVHVYAASAVRIQSVWRGFVDRAYAAELGLLRRAAQRQAAALADLDRVAEDVTTASDAAVGVECSDGNAVIEAVGWDSTHTYSSSSGATLSAESVAPSLPPTAPLSPVVEEGDSFLYGVGSGGAHDATATTPYHRHHTPSAMSSSSSVLYYRGDNAARANGNTTTGAGVGGGVDATVLVPIGLTIVPHCTPQGPPLPSQSMALLLQQSSTALFGGQLGGAATDSNSGVLGGELGVAGATPSSLDSSLMDYYACFPPQQTQQEGGDGVEVERLSEVHSPPLPPSAFEPAAFPSMATSTVAVPSSSLPEMAPTAVSMAHHLSTPPNASSYSASMSVDNSSAAALLVVVTTAVETAPTNPHPSTAAPPLSPAHIAAGRVVLRAMKRAPSVAPALRYRVFRHAVALLQAAARGRAARLLAARRLHSLYVIRDAGAAWVARRRGREAAAAMTSTTAAAVSTMSTPAFAGVFFAPVSAATTTRAGVSSASLTRGSMSTLFSAASSIATASPALFPGHTRTPTVSTSTTSVVVAASSAPSAPLFVDTSAILALAPDQSMAYALGAADSMSSGGYSDADSSRRSVGEGVGSGSVCTGRSSGGGALGDRSGNGRVLQPLPGVLVTLSAGVSSTPSFEMTLTSKQQQQQQQSHPLQRQLSWADHEGSSISSSSSSSSSSRADLRILRTGDVLSAPSTPLSTVALLPAASAMGAHSSSSLLPSASIRTALRRGAAQLYGGTTPAPITRAATAPTAVTATTLLLPLPQSQTVAASPSSSLLGGDASTPAASVATTVHVGSLPLSAGVLLGAGGRAPLRPLSSTAANTGTAAAAGGKRSSITSYIDSHNTSHGEDTEEQVDRVAAVSSLVDYPLTPAKASPGVSGLSGGGPTSASKAYAAAAASFALAATGAAGTVIVASATGSSSSCSGTTTGSNDGSSGGSGSSSAAEVRAERALRVLATTRSLSRVLAAVAVLEGLTTRHTAAATLVLRVKAIPALLGVLRACSPTHGESHTTLARKVVGVLLPLIRLMGATAVSTSPTAVVGVLGAGSAAGLATLGPLLVPALLDGLLVFREHPAVLAPLSAALAATLRGLAPDDAAAAVAVSTSPLTTKRLASIAAGLERAGGGGGGGAPLPPHAFMLLSPPPGARGTSGGRAAPLLSWGRELGGGGEGCVGDAAAARGIHDVVAALEAAQSHWKSGSSVATRHHVQRQDVRGMRGVPLLAGDATFAVTPIY